MIEIKLIIMGICSALFWWGGFSWHNARRFIMPLILTLTALVLTHWCWWTLLMLSCSGAFCLGYGEKSPLKHIFGNGFGRGIWGLLAAICLSLPLFLTHHLAWPLLHSFQSSNNVTYLFSFAILIAYLALNFTLENALKNIPQWLGDPLIGLGFSLIVLLIR